jgi:hypothetical protein
VRHSASARRRKGKALSYQALVFHPNTLVFCFFKYLNFFAAFAPLREEMLFSGFK